MKAQAKNKQPERRGCWLWVNAKTLEGALDPLFLAFSLCVSLSAIAAGIYTIIKSNAFNFSVNNWDEFTQVRACGCVRVIVCVLHVCCVCAQFRADGREPAALLLLATAAAIVY